MSGLEQKPHVQDRPVAERVLTPEEIESRAKSWERTFEALKACPKALNRLYDLMNHTLTSDDGETLFIPVEDAAEVYTILFMAWSAGKEMLDDLVRYMDGDEKDRAITGIAFLVAKSETDDKIEFGDPDENTKETDLVIATNWT